MKLIVPIKQVPETGNVKMDEEKGTMVRDGVESIVNPLDLYSIECALKLKEEHGGTVTVISMGPPKAEKAIREALSMGCDEGILLTDKAFAGSDTWATSYVISEAIKTLGDFDLIVAGVRATDGDTGQVGPEIAAMLDLPIATFVSRINSIENGIMNVTRLVEGGYEQVKFSMPALITVVNEISFPRLPTLRGKQTARTKDIPVVKKDDLAIDSDSLGLEGSPTRVVKIMRPKVIRNGVILDVNKIGIKKAVEELVNFLEEKNFV
ncbi:MAG: electron transfer flavoprotein subunit beta/FixA family protein [Candidatus Latescibacteria bacterium]|nr:electron transfer flavoprotein subunit beta/FixA family protein [Candidatus Latescibacterota bacterium]